MATQARLMTAADLSRLPEDGFRYELIEGELRRMTPAGYRHGLVAMRFAWRLASHVEANDLGTVCAAETGFLLSSNPDTVRAPDIAFVARSLHQDEETVSGYRPGAPDLVVEVLSPADTYSEVESKVMAWLDAGTRIALVLDPERRQMTAYRSRSDIRILTAQEIFEAKDVVPGWSLRVADLFDRI
jgi:Uma2 family endonuclease